MCTKVYSVAVRAWAFIIEDTSGITKTGAGDGGTIFAA
jgi:hypothetical protein